MTEVSGNDRDEGAETPELPRARARRGRPKVTWTINAKILARAKAKAKLEGVALSRVVETALETWTETAGDPEAAGMINETPDNTTEESRF